jgi:hypothetical protein
MPITLPPPLYFTWHIGALSLPVVFLGEALPRWHLSSFPISCLCASSNPTVHTHLLVSSSIMLMHFNAALLLLGLRFLGCHAIFFDPLTTPIDGESQPRPPLILINLFTHFLLIAKSLLTVTSWWRTCFYSARLLGWWCSWALSRFECSCKP